VYLTCLKLLSSKLDAREGQTNAQQGTEEAVQTVYPRYDVPFNRENIKDFFTFRRGVVENAIQECITALLFPEDGEYLGSWLLTECVEARPYNMAPDYVTLVMAGNNGTPL
ncbi:jg25493, partial [Pararge aegeria aegeria]